MPKRKRPTYENESGRTLQKQKKDVAENLTQSKTLLHRALKRAKAFERQKLGKRFKLATEQDKSEDVQRINREIEVLKGLNLDDVTEAHLYKSLLKIKVIAESDLLPEDVRREIEKPDMEEGERKALHNVMSGMLNIKAVKDAMGGIIAGMYGVLGIPSPVIGKEKAKEPSRDVLKASFTDSPKGLATVDGASQEKSEGVEASWDGFDSEDQNLEGNQNGIIRDSSEKSNSGEDEDIDEENLSRYDALLGVSSDEESFDEEIYKSKQPSQPSARLSLSLSPSPSLSPSEIDIQSGSESPSISPPHQKAPNASKVKPPKEPVKSSTFLPSLMGGYWSGSESSPSDDEAQPIRKNRPGQMARRAIWEKKFGVKANHIKSGKGPVAGRKDDGWDPKRGATDGRGGRGGRGGGRGGRQRNFSKVTAENAMPVGEGTWSRRLEKKDDVGVIHPSWQAAKKAKAEQKKATFAGKKVVFN